jgi:hypothetical protein
LNPGHDLVLLGLHSNAIEAWHCDHLVATFGGLATEGLHFFTTLMAASKLGFSGAVWPSTLLKLFETRVASISCFPERRVFNTRRNSLNL